MTPDDLRKSYPFWAKVVTPNFYNIPIGKTFMFARRRAEDRVEVFSYAGDYQFYIFDAAHVELTTEEPHESSATSEPARDHLSGLEPMTPEMLDRVREAQKVELIPGEEPEPPLVIYDVIVLAEGDILTVSSYTTEEAARQHVTYFLGEKQARIRVMLGISSAYVRRRTVKTRFENG